MRLLKVKLNDFRRFEDSDALLVSDDLVAIVGPNEAGKTSLLTALDQIDRNRKLPRRFATRQKKDAAPEVRALFELEPDDVEALAGIEDTDRLKRFWVVRSIAGTRHILEDPPLPAIRHRQQVAAALGAIAGEVALDSLRAEPDSNLDADLEFATQQAESTVDTLNAQAIPVLTRLAAELYRADVDEPDAAVNDPEYLIQEQEREERLGRLRLAADALAEMADLEAQPSPSVQAWDVIRERIPPIVSFSQSDRDLSSEYDLSDFDPPAEEDGEALSPPEALINLLALAEVDLHELRQAMANDPSQVSFIREKANQKLQAYFDQHYAQSDVSLRIETDDTLLRVQSRAEGGSDIISIAEKSDGFKWFAALVAFLAKREYEKPIVLIDEVETHLHYAAQADVIDILASQEIAPQIIYTTHSAGSLPPDLGRGIRAVVQVSGEQRSRIDNAFWTSGPGATPILFAMGVAALPFSIPRYLLVVEGGADAILLPTLLREATGEQVLPYRIAPGIANTSSENFARLEHEAAMVAYLVDADGAGDTYSSELSDAAGVPEARIFRISEQSDAIQFVSPEDFVDPSLFVAAVNEASEAFWPKGTELLLADLPDVNTSKFVEDWCKAKEVSKPSKTAIAQRVVQRKDVSIGTEDPPSALLRAEAHDRLKALHQAIVAALAIETS